MTSEFEPSNLYAPFLWITGLSGVGKSSLANALALRLREAGERPLILDGDVLRDTLEERDGAGISHALDQREHRAWRMARLAHLAVSQGVPVICATISLFHAVQRFNRNTCPLYAEVWLQASVDTLRRRNPTLYGDTQTRIAHHVVGVDLPAEYPEKAELIIVQNFGAETLTKQVDQVHALWLSMRGATA